VWRWRTSALLASSKPKHPCAPPNEISPAHRFAQSLTAWRAGIALDNGKQDQELYRLLENASYARTPNGLKRLLRRRFGPLAGRLVAALLEIRPVFLRCSLMPFPMFL